MAIPTLAPNCTWFTQGGTSVKRASITQINIVDSYTPTGGETASWDASAAKDGGVMCYVNDTVLTIAGNGSGKILANADSSCVFSDSAKKDYYSNLTVINGGNLLDTSNATTFISMFGYATALETVDVSNWDTSKVTSFRTMFQNATSIGGLDVSKWQTGNVTDMTAFFNMSLSNGMSNSNLKTLDVSRWDVSKVTSMKNTFFGCVGLLYLDLSRWDVGQVTNMKAFLGGHGDFGMAITSIGNVSNWNVSKVTNMSLMFQRCENLLKVDVSGWDVSNVTDMSGMFTYCFSLRKLNFANWDTTNCGDVSYMIQHTRNLRELTVGEKFSFNGNGSSERVFASLPDPAYIPGADGNWYDIDKNAYAPTAIPNKTAGTYYASLELVDKALNGSRAGKKYLLNRIFSPVIARVLMRKEG